MGENDEDSSESEEHVETPDEDVAAPAIPFCASKMDLIIDFRSVCSLPHDPDVEGVKALRAITFGKGHGIHAPNAPGKIYVWGEWKTVNALSKVHFVSATHRDPELLLGFVDYGFANSSMSGVSVETLALPLLLSKGVYQNSIRVTRVEDVAGFTPINPGQAPWSINLKPALLKQDLFKCFKIYAPADINKWMASQKMEKRVELLAKRTRSAMTEVVKEQARQDAPQAEKTKAVFEAKLATILAAIEALPPSAYDFRIASRVEQLVEDRDKETYPVWLTSPLAHGMREGTAEFVRTRLHGAAAPKPKPVARPAANSPANSPVISPVRTMGSAPHATTTTDTPLELSNDEDDEVASENSDVQEAQVRESARSKRVPSRLAQQEPVAKKPKAPPKSTAKQAPPSGYKRGPYNTNKKDTAAKMVAKAEKKLKNDTTSADKLELASLKLQLKSALEAKKAAEEMLKQHKEMVELQVDKAKAEGEKEGLRAASEEYKKGVAAGAAIAFGKPMTFAPQDTPSQSSGSGRSASFSHHSFGQL